MNLLDELREYLLAMRLVERFDLIAPIERKGTALLRILVESYQNATDYDLGLEPDRIIGSEALKHLEPESLYGKRIFLFDDTIFTGRRMNSECSSLRKKGAEVECSAFAVCEHADFLPDSWYYNHLSFQDYSRLKEEIINLISGSEKLLLDTEHLGLHVHCKLNARGITEKIRTLGDVLEIARPKVSETKFYSIHDPSFFNHDLTYDSSILPSGKSVHKFFCKIRFLIQDFKFWIVPIAFEPTPVQSTFKECPTFLVTREKDMCMCPEPHGTSRSPFYCRSLFWSSKLLSATLKHLHQVMEIEYDFASPRDFPLENLQALFPQLNVQKWRLWIKEMSSSSEDIDQILDKEPTKHQIIHFSKETKQLAMALMIKLLEKYEEAEIDAELLEGNLIWEDDIDARSISYKDLFETYAHKPRELISQAFDVLIDQSRIVPTTVIVSENGQKLYERGARLDGEYIYQWTRLLRKSLEEGSREMEKR